MTLRQAIIRVMSRQKTPMSYREIWDLIKKRRLYRTPAKAPWQSVGSVLYSNPDLFRKVKPSKFVLKRGAASKLSRQPSRRMRQTKETRGGLLDAIIRVLEDATEDLHYTEVTDRVLRRGPWVTRGKTPAQTVGAYLYKHKDIFQQTTTGTFRLGRRRPKGVKGRGGAIQRADGFEFERRMADFLTGMGLADVTVTRGSRDRGVDIWAYHTTQAGTVLRVGVQTKNWADGQVGSRGVRDLRGAIRPDDVGMLVATVELSKEAWRIPQDMPRPRLILIDGDKLAELNGMAPARLRQYAREMLG
jgi:hypothetical protein